MKKTKKIAFLGMMLAIVFVLSFIEHMTPPLPFLPPGAKLGLSNIVTMYCAFFVGKSSAISINALKALFVFMTRGPVAGLLSFSGGMLSIIMIIILSVAFKEKISYVILSVFGAIAHNIGQFAAVSLFFNTPYMVYYLPVMLVAGLITGIITGLLLKVVMPFFNKVFRR